jgi:hypothetical protein
LQPGRANALTYMEEYDPLPLHVIKPVMWETASARDQQVGSIKCRPSGPRPGVWRRHRSRCGVRTWCSTAVTIRPVNCHGRCTLGRLQMHRCIFAVGRIHRMNDIPWQWVWNAKWVPTKVASGTPPRRRISRGFFAMWSTSPRLLTGVCYLPTGSRTRQKTVGFVYEHGPAELTS